MIALLASSLALALPPDAPDARQNADATPGPLERDPSGLGVGIILGLPTGISLAYKSDQTPVFFDAAVAYSFAESVVIHGDVCLRLSEMRSEDIPEFVFPVWIGVGPRLYFGATDTAIPFVLATRVPFGMAIYHERVPIEGFVELVPGIGVYPSTSFIFDAAVGGRFYFGSFAKP